MRIFIVYSIANCIHLNIEIGREVFWDMRQLDTSPGGDEVGVRRAFSMGKVRAAAFNCGFVGDFESTHAGE